MSICPFTLPSLVRKHSIPLIRSQQKHSHKPSTKYSYRTCPICSEKLLHIRHIPYHIIQYHTHSLTHSYIYICKLYPKNNKTKTLRTHPLPLPPSSFPSIFFIFSFLFINCLYTSFCTYYTPNVYSIFLSLYIYIYAIIYKVRKIK
ncbi:hypothetical protein F4703DRAFT_1037601 [Phycomyces blakesleeanus]